MNSSNIPDDSLLHVMWSGIMVADEVAVAVESQSVDADERGRVLFRESVDADLFATGLGSCIRIAQRAIAAAQESVAGYAVDKVTLQLGVDAKLGCVFVGDAGVRACIQVELKRTQPAGQND
jgi:hypothetical protein